MMTSLPATPVLPEDITDDTPPEQVRLSLEHAFRGVADTLARTPADAFLLHPGSDQRRTAAVYLAAELAGALQHLTAGLNAVRPDLHTVLNSPGLTVDDVSRDQITAGTRVLRSPLVSQLTHTAAA